ncbi:MAG TPA: hypothetical protein VGL71_00470 [Urbifossiella sp.]|jgi:hypothetical protein
MSLPAFLGGLLLGISAGPYIRASPGIVFGDAREVHEQLITNREIGELRLLARFSKIALCR